MKPFKPCTCIPARAKKKKKLQYSLSKTQTVLENSGSHEGNSYILEQIKSPLYAFPLGKRKNQGEYT